MRANIGNRLVASLKPRTTSYEVRDIRLKGFMIRVLPSGTMTYLCEYGRGKRKRIGRTDVFTPAQARDEAIDTLLKAARGEDPLADKKAAKAHTLDSFLTEIYGPWAESHHKTGAATVKMLQAGFPELRNKKLDDITAWSIDKWRSVHIKSGKKHATVNRYVSTLKAALSKAVMWKMLSTNPLVDIKPMKVDSNIHVRYLDATEERSLRHALDAREARIRKQRTSANAWRHKRGYIEKPEFKRTQFADALKPMVLISINTGLRRGELLSLTWEDVNFSLAQLTVHGDRSKSGKTRYIPLNEEAVLMFKKWRTCCEPTEGLIFASRSGGTRFDIAKPWANLLNDAGITSFRWHDMRHHFASMLIMKGVDLNTVRELLGHSDPKMTLRYAHLAPEVKAEAVSRLVNK